MVSIDLKDAYLQVLMHPESKKYLWFMAFGKVYQFKVLCFGLSTAPQVFTRVMVPVSAILYSLGIRLRRYLDGWLIQASSREQVLLALRTVLRCCNSLGIVVNWEKSQLVPTQKMMYLGVLLNSVIFRASPAQKRVDKLLSIGDVFLSCVNQPVKSWLELLGVLSSLTLLILGGRPRMRSFQFVLHRAWDHLNPEAHVRWSPEIRQDLLWWLDRELGSAPRQGGSFRPLVSRGPAQLHQSSRTVSNFLCAPAFSSACSERHSGGVCGQHDSAGLPAESGGHQICGFEPDGSGSSALGGAPFHLPSASVHHGAQQRVGRFSLSSTSDSGFQQLRRKWPVSIDLFATSLNHRGLPYFSPFRDPNALGTDALLEPWDGWQAYAFPPYGLIPAILRKLRSSSGVLLTIISPYWPQRPWFPELVVDGPVALPLDRDLLSQPHVHRQHPGLSKLALHAWRLSSDL